MTSILAEGEVGRAGLVVELASLARAPNTAGAGEGIRTLDPDLGKVVLYP